MIPSRNEKYLVPTVQEVFSKASGDVECCVVLDGGEWPNPPLPENPKLIVIRRSESRGMRAAINDACAATTGKWIMKLDAHCRLSEGYDEILTADCEDNTILIPRRKRLDVENWCEKDIGKKPDVDYEFLRWPFEKPEEIGLQGCIWTERILKRKDIALDEDMSFQGSCWVARRSHWNRLGGMSEKGYGRFIAEAQELGLKTQLGGGAVMISKRASYMHWHKGKEVGRGYFLNKKELVLGQNYCAWFWMNNQWQERQRDIKWLIERFWPIPTWPDNWEDEVPKWERQKDGMVRKVR